MSVANSDKPRTTTSQFAISARVCGNPIRQLSQSESFSGPKPKLKNINAKEIRKLPKLCDKVRNSWKEKFYFKEEQVDSGKSYKKGLRPPQIGALFASLAHWKTANSQATIVIPTGIGKTEVMLALMVCQRLERVLVVVPTDALREQITDKFLGLGLLKDLGVVGKRIHFPVVGTLEHHLRTVDEVKQYLSCCNVIVTTMGVINGCSEAVQRMLAETSSHLFIDEAHHISAPTWKKFKEFFENKPILQFTATPFRNDGRVVEGKIIFNFPLKNAQEQGYFKQIQYDPVFEYDPQKVDIVIAEKAVKQLRDDLKKGHNHILMARVDSISRAQEVFSIYKQYTEFNPVQIHTGIKSKKERDEIRRKIINKESRVVVCVDMFGEGFDLPELKIAAFHDVKKSLPITLQLVGRFTRSRSDLGDPTFVANAANVDVSDELKKLYSQDADWNVLLPQSSEKVTQEQVNLWEFLEGFNKFPKEIPLQNIRPAMSTVIYNTKCKDWKPENWPEGFKGIHLDRVQSDINSQTSTLVIITARKVSIDWAQIKDIYNWDWELFVVFWDKEQNLLFINSSSNIGHFQNLAKAVAGDDVNIVREVPVFRCFGGVNRLKLQNVGLIEQLGRLIRYTMRSGSDVETGLTQAQIRNVKKANIFGVGYEDGGKTSIGCSYKGRIWSRRIANVESLTRWCKKIGSKILDTSIDPDKVLKGTLVPIFVKSRPKKVPICIDWPEIIYNEPETIYEIIVDGKHIPLYEAELRLKNLSEDGDLSFEITDETTTVELVLRFISLNGGESYKFEVVGKHNVVIKQKNNQSSIEDFFNENTPKIWFYDGSVLEGNSYTELKWKYPPYDSNKIQAWDWTGTNIQKESQKIDQQKDSIQFRVIQELNKGKYDVIFDDDGSGEISDVITIKDDNVSIGVGIYHCKFSKESIPGQRIEDLYTVCGQAQKCVSWLEKPDDILKHMLRRDAKRFSSTSKSRFMVGNKEGISKLLMKLTSYPLNVKVSIVQPGLSKGKATREQLELLSVTENYLMETYKLPFEVIASQ